MLQALKKTVHSLPDRPCFLQDTMAVGLRMRNLTYEKCS